MIYDLLNKPWHAATILAAYREARRNRRIAQAAEDAAHSAWAAALLASRP